MGLSRFLFLFIAVVHISAISLDAADVAAIEASWSSQESSAATARIVFYETFFDCRKSKLSAEDIAGIVNGLNLSHDEKVIEELIQKLNPEFFKKQQAHDQKKQKWNLWKKWTLIDDGFRERVTNEDKEHVIAHGLHLVSDRLNHEINCYERGQCEYHYYQLNWFLDVPSVKLLQNVVSIDESDSKLTLRRKSGSWMVLDVDSHLPIDEELISSSGELMKKTFSREFAVYPGDVALPAIRIEISFRDSLAHHAMITVVEDARFNVDVSESEFVLPAVAKTSMADYRGEKRRARRLKQDIDDSAEYFLAGALGTNSVAPTDPQTFNWKAFFLILNGVVLIVLGVALWRRAS